MQFNKPTILLVDAHRFFSDKIQRIEKYFNVITADSPSAGIKMAFHRDLDLIVLDLDVTIHNPFELSMQFKQSMITRNIPVIIVSNDESLKTRLNTFKYGGVDYLAKSSSVDAIITKLSYHCTVYERAKKHQYLDFHSELKPENQLDMRLSKLQRRGNEEGLALLIFEIDTTKVIVSFAEGKPINEAMCLDILETIIKRTIHRENDSYVRLNNRKIALILPQTGLTGALGMANRVNETFYFTVSAPNARISFPENALKVGITAVDGLHQHGYDSIRIMTEKALEEAKCSNEFFCVS
jgi:PleD family two-component response regulator